jgi:ABC-type oligopeptide transport system substrate-binding subunit
MDSLTRLVPDGRGGYTFAPAGAASWESNAAGTVWTFHLNNNKWSDGVPVTAADYEFGLKRIANPATGAPLADMINPLLNFDAVVQGTKSPEELGVKALDAKTLQITLTNPVPFFLSLTYDRVFAPQRKDLLEKWGEQYGSEAQYSVANGPFKVESWVHNNQIVLVKNENYWDAASVKLDRVVYRIITDITTALNAFESGELDMVAVPDLEWRDKFKTIKGIQFYEVPSQSLTYSFFNNADPIFKNKNIRKAFMLGVDREELNVMCFGSLRQPTYGWVVPSITVGETNFRGAVGDPIKEIAAASASPRDLLLQGMRELGLGTDPAALNVTFSLAGTSDWYQTLGAYLQQIYKTTLGINLKIDFSEWGIFYDNVQKGNYQIGFMGWGAFYNDPYDVLSLFTSGSNAIMTNWKNNEYDALMAASISEMDDAKRLNLYRRAERLMLEDAAASPLACAISNWFVQGYVKNYTPSTFGTPGNKYLSIEGK